MAADGGGGSSMETGLSGEPAAGGPDAGTPPSGARSPPWGEAQPSGKRGRERAHVEANQLHF